MTKRSTDHGVPSSKQTFVTQALNFYAQGTSWERGRKIIRARGLGQFLQNRLYWGKMTKKKDMIMGRNGSGRIRKRELGLNMIKIHCVKFSKS